ncbi:phosphodiesterase [Reticulomyxa filosa]|uniref:Phosphodiesterase n=1 Tax=Reticulomyxa filosa TaxID=46433 RepID=X6NW28_RETFI|nr:phosphodiesterase [Reticulomyxa filosa]|eukprot:ETO30206.1 phosphodiesterase [Reticulomyxa filosa]
MVEDVICQEAPLRVDGIVNERFFLLETVVHLADVSNPAKPLEIAKTWAYRVMDEFYHQALLTLCFCICVYMCQGDEERKLGIPVTPMMDKQSPSAQIAKVQVGFLQFVIVPFFESFNALCPDIEECFVTLKKNLEYWKEQCKEPQASHVSTIPNRGSVDRNSTENADEAKQTGGSEDSKTKTKTKQRKSPQNPKVPSREPRLKSIEEEDNDDEVTSSSQSSSHNEQRAATEKRMADLLEAEKQQRNNPNSGS